MTETVTLAARNEPPGALPQVLYIPASSTAMYTVEWIDADNYDLDNLYPANQASPVIAPCGEHADDSFHKIRKSDDLSGHCARRCSNGGGNSIL